MTALALPKCPACGQVIPEPEPEPTGLTVTFFAPGVPQTKGSKSIGRHGQLYESGAGLLKEWMNSIAWAAKFAKVTFTSEMQLFVRTDFKVARNIGDGDKLTRAVWDALQAVEMIHNDNQIVAWAGSRMKVPPSDTGCLITVREVIPSQDLPR